MLVLVLVYVGFFQQGYRQKRKKYIYARENNNNQSKSQTTTILQGEINDFMNPNLFYKTLCFIEKHDFSDLGKLSMILLK